MKRIILSSTVILGLMSFATSPSGRKPSKKMAMRLINGFCEFVPSGNVSVEGNTSSVQAFYMSSSEISNHNYSEFLSYLKRTGETEKLEIAKVHGTEWKKIAQHMEPFETHYASHPAYRDYPVVNVSREGAELYCEWLSSMYDSISNGEMKVKFRLPTRAEWVRAARGGLEKNTYSWGGPYLRNAQGLLLANFANIGAGNITRDKETGKLKVIVDAQSYPITMGDNADVTAPVKSYFPNGYGLYNMNGNVSEMVSDGNIAVGGDWHSPGYDIRNESKKTMEGPSPTIGFRVVATYIGPVKTRQ